MHKIDCPIHGRTFAAYFLMPKPHSYAESGYVCAHCVNAIESAPHGGEL